MIRLLFFFVLAVLPNLHAKTGMAIDLRAVRGSVMKIYVVAQEPSFSEPWSRGRARSSTGSGFYIGDNRILTNAHVVAQGKFITVLRDGEDHPVTARVLHIAHDCDLALLAVQDEDYLKGAVPLKFGGLPRLRSPVSTIGYPKGGEQISVTKGVVSRISFRRYAHSAWHRHLLVQVDSAINSGNSGGPVLQDLRVVGVAFQSHSNAENTGYIIPTAVIRRFLIDVEDGTYDGHPEHGLRIINGALENEATRQWHGLSIDDGGVKIASVDPGAPTAGHIQPGDIILQVAGQPVGLDGKITFQGERIDFRTLIDLRQRGEKIRFRLSRDRQGMTAEVPLTATRGQVAWANSYPEFPPYFAFGGVVFTPLSRDYLKGWGNKWYRKAPVHLRYVHWQKEWESRFREARDVVVLATRLPDPLNAFAKHHQERILDKVNGVAINSIREIPDALNKGDPDFIVFEFFGDVVPLVMPRAVALARNEAILERYGISRGSWFAGQTLASGNGDDQPADVDPTTRPVLNNTLAPQE